MFQIVDFSSINDLKFTYVRLQFQKFFPRLYPWTPHYKGEGRRRERRGGEGSKGWDEVNPPPNTNPGYGPVINSNKAR
jgi:hypothetical protein